MKPILKRNPIVSLGSMFLNLTCIYIFGVFFNRIVLDGKSFNCLEFLFPFLLCVIVPSFFSHLRIYRGKLEVKSFWFMTGLIEMEKIYAIESVHFFIPYLCIGNSTFVWGRKEVSRLESLLFSKHLFHCPKKILSCISFLYLFSANYHKILKHLVLNTPLETKISPATLKIIGMTMDEVMDIKKVNTVLPKIVVHPDDQEWFDKSDKI